MPVPQFNADIRCFIFDLDGTLVRNEEANLQAYEAAFRSTGHTLDHDIFLAHFQSGGSIEDIYADHVARHGLQHDPAVLSQIMHRKTGEYTQRFDLIEPNVVIIGLLRALAPHYHTALATTSRQANGGALLKHFGLLELFDYTVFGEDVTHKKPDPECHKKIAEHFAVRPDQCVIFEDSPKGFAAAEAFGGHICKVVR